MADNVDFARLIVFRVPSVRYTSAIIAVLSLIFGLGTFMVFSDFFSLQVDATGLMISVMFFYLLPAYLVAELSYRSVPASRDWTYLMAVFDQCVMFLFSLTVLLADNAGEVWQVMWLSLATIYIVNLGMLVMVKGKIASIKTLFPAAAYSFVAFIALSGAFELLVGIPSYLYLLNLILFAATVLTLLFSWKMYDFILAANANASATELTSGVLLREPEAIKGVNGGFTTDIYHQALHIDNGKNHTFTIPWVHSGPAGGFGSGLLNPELIDESTFLMHIPCSHYQNLVDPEDIQRFKPAPEVQTSSEASEMVKLKKGGFKIYGRKYESGKIVYVQNRRIDDYNPMIAYRLKEKHPDLALIDLHNHQRDQGEKLLQKMDPEANILEEGVEEMLEILDEQEMHPYKAGVAGNGDYRCLVEEVNGQKTCMLGINASSSTPALKQVEEEMDFDHNLTFTTDTHEDIVDLNSTVAPRYDPEDLRGTVEEAEKNVSDAKAGIGERTVEEVELLGRDSDYLTATLNIMSRLIPITFLLYYLGIVFLIL